jgi:molybdopterin-guanine dinucleotide biosynthesis protein B
MKAFCITGYSGSGKTTLLEAIIPRIAARGLVVSLIKHTHHKFDIDQPGKDSYRLREAGCREVMLLSDNRWVLMHELRGAEPPSLEEQLTKFSDCDLVLVEGFKQAALPKLEVHRPANGKPPLVASQPEHIVAVASDEPVLLPEGIPLLDLNDRDALVDFILRHQGLQ